MRPRENAASFVSPQSPVTGVVGAVLGLLMCAYLSIHWGEPGWWGTSINRSMLIWGIIAIIFIVMGLIDQWILKGYQKKNQAVVAYHRTTGKLFYAAAWRFAGLVLALTAARVIYFNNAFYLSGFYAPFRQFFGYLYLVFLFLGFPYVVLTLRWHGALRAEFKDPAIHILLWIRTCLRRVLISQKKKNPWTVFRNGRTKIVFLGFLVEFFYLPLMTVFVINQYNDFSSNLNRMYFHLAPSTWSYGIYPVFYHGIYLMDVLIAMGGYAVPLRWLDNKIASVEPTLMGWVVALICYPPFDAVPSNFLTYGPSSDTWVTRIPELLAATQVVGILLALIYSVATMMFGTRFSNLTNRGILNRGPYGVVRHPAYIAKNLSWWCEKLPLMINPWNIVVLVGWNIIYGLRAWTEERHLSKDPAYRAYRQQVKYRFIPGIF